MTSQFRDMTSSLIFWRYFVFLSRLITGRIFMSISSLVLELWPFSFMKDCQQIFKSEVPPVWLMSIIWILGRVKDTKFGKNISNKMLPNAAKCQGYSFYHFWVTKRKPTGEGKITPSRLGLNSNDLLSLILELHY